MNHGRERETEEGSSDKRAKLANCSILKDYENMTVAVLKVSH